MIRSHPIPVNKPVLDSLEQDEILLSCYTGDDFVAVCEGDEEKARRLFAYCDWQHPTSVAYDEGAVDDDEDDEELTSEFE